MTSKRGRAGEVRKGRSRQLLSRAMRPRSRRSTLRRDGRMGMNQATHARWHVEVTVDGFGPNHSLWRRFIDIGARLADDSVQWELTQRGQTARIQATVTARTADEAARRLMQLVRQAGRAVDRNAAVSWLGL